MKLKDRPNKSFVTPKRVASSCGLNDSKKIFVCIDDFLSYMIDIETGIVEPNKRKIWAHYRHKTV